MTVTASGSEACLQGVALCVSYPCRPGWETVGGMSATPLYEADVTRGDRAITFLNSVEWGNIP
jgi:hypothetical protein